MQNWQLGKTAPCDKLIPNPKARLREQVREVMRFHHYSPRTEEAYWQWIKRFITGNIETGCGMSLASGVFIAWIVRLG